jgi:hypothetical protein
MKQLALVAVVLSFLAFVPQASAVIHDTTIYEIQMGNIPLGDSVRVDSVIVTALDLKPTTYGFTAQEIPGGPYSGILVYSGGIRPDTLGGGVGVVPGDMVTVVGRYAEYTTGSGTVSEIDLPTITIVQKGYGELAPQLMSCADLADSLPTGPDFGEPWEGVWLAIDTVVVVEHFASAFKEWTVREAHNHPGLVGTNDVVRIDDKLVDPTLPWANVGDTLALIKGAFSFEYSTYRMWPRADSDVVYLGLPPGPNVVVAYPVDNNKIDIVFDRSLNKASAEDINNYGLSSGTAVLSGLLDASNDALVHLTTDPQPVSQLDVLTACDVESGFGVAMDSCMTYSFRAGITPISFVQTPSAGDTSQCDGQQVTVAGIVTSPTAAFGGPYFMQTRAGGPWSGIYVYQFTNTFFAGDSVVVSGIVQEYYNMTELVSVDYQKRIPVAAPVNVSKVDCGTVKTGAPAAESYEAVMVEVDSVDVCSLFDLNGEWLVKEGTDTLMIGTHGTYTYIPGIGSVVSVKGPLEFYFAQFKIQPRSDADIVVVEACPAGVDPKELSLNLFQNRPNPFGAETSIRFSIPAKTHVSLAVYDVNGRLVTSVYEQDLAPGEYHAVWNGRDSNGSGVSSGVYFVRLATPQRTLEKKMVYVK